MLDLQTELIRRILCVLTLIGVVRCQLPCLPPVNNVYFSENGCIYICSSRLVLNGYLLCKSDGRTAVPCAVARDLEELGESSEECTNVHCQLIQSPACNRLHDIAVKVVRFVKTNITIDTGNTYIHAGPAKSNTHLSHGDFPRITFEEPGSQMYVYGILSFFFGVIAFFIFALVFRFLYKRYQRHPVHVHTFSGHQFPLGGLQLRSFLSPLASAPYTQQVPFQRNEQPGIPGLDLPPSYVVASELLDPPPSYEDISKTKRNSAQMKVTSL